MPDEPTEKKQQVSPQFLKAFYRRMIQAGYTPKEAGNLTASLLGLKASKNGWAIKELVGLLFIREISSKGEEDENG